ncbi:MAG: SOS response-associated peptidase [Chitinophagales bacterium]|nr:SOS response-associated peptidase [Chitinophagales bacterium]
MCGRFSFSTSPKKIQEHFGDIETGENLRMNFNVAPTQYSYVITDKDPHKLSYFRWGLVPHWSKDAKNAARLINARMEGIASKPSFRVPIRKRRCLIIADSFYEWKKENGKKIPFRILPKKDQLLVMGGIWDVWYKNEEPMSTFSIITTPPNKEVAPIHNRMPLIFTKKREWGRWLSELHIDQVLELMDTSPDGILRKYQVSDRVNSVRNNGIELHREIGGQGSLFD